MSHFTVLVIGEDPEGQLAPYDENIEVDEYIREAVSEEEKKRFMEYYIEKHPDQKDKTFDELYEEYGDSWNGGSWKKDEDGVLQEYSTYNPKSKWDWYSLGGRWSGLIQLKEGAEGVEGESGVFNNETGIDAARKGDIANLDEIRTFAVVKDGQWYERGEMGWWACVSNEKPDDEWEAEFRKLLEGLPDDTMISIYDCHI